MSYTGTFTAAELARMNREAVCHRLPEGSRECSCGHVAANPGAALLHLAEGLSPRAAHTLLAGTRFA